MICGFYCVNVVELLSVIVHFVILIYYVLFREFFLEIFEGFVEGIGVLRLLNLILDQ